MSASSQIRAACYCRISSDPKDKREGVDRQREDTEILCEKNRWQIAGYYIDNDKSASNGKRRPEWERLLADIEAGKIDAVAAFDQDRVNRTMDDFISYQKLFTERGIKLATSNNGDIDLSTPSGRLTATIKTAVSTHEIDMMKIRMKRAARQKAEQGVPKWTHAFGYRRAGDVIELDPVTAPLVKDAYAALRAGASLRDLCKLFNDAGQTGGRGKPWTPWSVSVFLRAARNAGLRSHTHDGVTEIVGKGQWPAIVDEQTWRQAQMILSDDKRQPGRKSVRRHLLTGLLLCGKCGDGQYLTGGQSAQGVRLYSCKKCRGVSIRAGHVEALMFKVVSGRLAMDDAADLLRSEVHDPAEAERIRRELATLFARRQQLAVDYAKGKIDGDQVQIATATINTDITDLERKQQDDEKRRVFSGVPLGTPEVADAIKRLTPGRFRAVLDLLATVTIAPIGRAGYNDPRTGRKGVNDRRVQVEWR